MFRTFLPRLWRALLLDQSLYDEVRDDRKATFPAVIVVVLASVSLSTLMLRLDPEQAGDWPVDCLIHWVIWAFILQHLAPRLFRTERPRPSFMQVLRPLGFAYSPIILSALAVVRELRSTLGTLIAVWVFLAVLAAVQQSFGYSSRKRAAAACLSCAIAMWTVIAGSGFILHWLASAAGLELDSGV